MKRVLARVTADQSEGGGYWNGPSDSRSGGFVYATIPELEPMDAGLNKPYADLGLPLEGLGNTLPPHVPVQHMHVDQSFNLLTHSDEGKRGMKILTKVRCGDLRVFYPGMRDIQRPAGLVLALIGLYLVGDIESAPMVSSARLHEDAHTRSILPSGGTDIAVQAPREGSGRLDRCIATCDYRQRAYRVWPMFLTAWARFRVNDGSFQCSARLPGSSQAGRFYDSLRAQNVGPLPHNN